MKLKKFLVLSTILLIIFSLFSVSYAYAEPVTLVKYGATGEGVMWVQDMLKQNGYTVTVDGVFGSITKNAIIHFQKYNNLDQDGIVGELTRSALKKAAAKISGNTSSNSSGSSITTQTINAYRYTTTNVNFRSGPSTSNTSYGVIEKGAEVYVYQTKSTGWSYVKYNNKYGYISSTYLSTTKPVTQSTTSNAYLAAFNRGSTNLLTIIKNCKSYYAKNNFIYSTASGVRSIPADKSISYNGNYYVDCSSYVSWVLYEYALANGKTDMKNYFSYQRNSATFANIGASGGNSYLQTVSGLSNAKAGDILVTTGHVEFLSSYTKNTNGTYTIKVYNCGSNSSIAVDGITTSATKNASEILYILRVR